MNRDPLTYRYARTTIEAFGCDAESAQWLYKYEAPMYRRFFYALCRHGWMVAVIALVALILGGCAGDIDDKRADAASLHDAIAQAQQSGKWTDEQKRRAKVAAEMVAQGVQP